MALQFSVDVRNGMLDAIESAIGGSAVLAIFTGAQPANCAAANSGTLLVEYELGADWADNAANGEKIWSDTPIGGTAVGTGEAGHFRLFASDGETCHVQGTVDESAADVVIDNKLINTGQTVNIVSWKWKAPGE